MRLPFFVLIPLVFCLSCETPDPPQACIQYESSSNNGVKEYDPITFTSCSKNTTVVVWDFGDGTRSGEEKVKHTYTQPGTYRVLLLASAPGATDSAFQTIVVEENTALTADKFSIELIRGDSQKFTCNPDMPIQFRIFDSLHNQIFNPDWLVSEQETNDLFIEYEDWEFNIFSLLGKSEFVEKVESPPYLECNKCYHYSWNVDNCESLTGKIFMEISVYFKGEPINNSPLKVTGFLPG